MDIKKIYLLLYYMSINLINEQGSKNMNLIDSLNHLSKQQKENSVGDKLAPGFANIQNLNTIETFVNYHFHYLLFVLIILVTIFIVIKIILKIM